MNIEGEVTPLLITLSEDTVQHIDRLATTHRLPPPDMVTSLFCQGFMGLELDEERGDALYLDVGKERLTLKMTKNLLEGDRQMTGEGGQDDFPIVGISPPIHIAMSVSNEGMENLMTAAQRRHSTINGLVVESIHTGLFMLHKLRWIINKTSEPVSLVVFKNGREEVYPINPLR